MTALPVAKVVVDLGMAGTAKAHQIVPCMSAALRDGNDVVYLIHRSQPSFLQTHLTERMRRSIAVTDAFPGFCQEKIKAPFTKEMFLQETDIIATIKGLSLIHIYPMPLRRYR